MEKIAIVNEQDEILGYEEKMAVHVEGKLHRAFSVLIYDQHQNMLIQQRSHQKYHSPSLWTNACCSHQLETDHDIESAAQRRIGEELGIEGLTLTEIGIVKYRCEFENGLIENEVDHIFVAHYNGEVPFNTQEIDAVKWISKEELLKWIEKEPIAFTHWFKLIMEEKIGL